MEQLITNLPWAGQDSVFAQLATIADISSLTKEDSVPYEVTITETRVVERPLSWFDKIARAVFFIVMVAVVLLIASWMAKKDGVR